MPTTPATAKSGTVEVKQAPKVEQKDEGGKKLAKEFKEEFIFI